MYLDPTDDTARALLGRGIYGPFLMLSLLRFHDWADYSQAPEQAPAVRISGRAAYDVYVEHTRPFLASTGGSVSLLADGGAFFVGPSDERWDVAMLIRQSSCRTSSRSPAIRSTWRAFAIAPLPSPTLGCSAWSSVSPA